MRWFFLPRITKLDPSKILSTNQVLVEQTVERVELFFF